MTIVEAEAKSCWQCQTTMYSVHPHVHRIPYDDARVHYVWMLMYQLRHLTSFSANNFFGSFHVEPLIGRWNNITTSELLKLLKCELKWIKAQLPACFLHDFGPIETAHFAKSFIAINDWKVHNLSICQKEWTVRCVSEKIKTLNTLE